MTSSIDFCSYDTLVDTTLIESSDLAPIASLFEREPEHTFVRRPTPRFRVAPRHALA
jgi:hypothetical protein